MGYSLNATVLVATPLNATNALKHFLIDQLVKFFLLIGQSNDSEAFAAKWITSIDTQIYFAS